MDSEIILIGNELLIGKIQDTNGQWMIHKLLDFGHRVTRIVTIPDNVDIIASTLNDSLKRHPSFIFISGGLGPTYDDMTNDGIAKAFNVNLVLKEEAKNYIIERYKKIALIKKIKLPELNGGRIKMAYLPENALALKNPSGAAPCGYIKHISNDKTTKIFTMPGFPDEMRSIFNEHIIPHLESADSSYFSAELEYQGIGESTIASDLVKLHIEYPEIWIKTLPMKSPKPPIRGEIKLTVFQDSNNKETIEELKGKLEELSYKIKDVVKNLGGKIIEIRMN
ncbi:MAG: competence/damage-inducible protein A [archaeon]|nr:competence/damage-inducible protein A [archaeon]